MRAVRNRLGNVLSVTLGFCCAAVLLATTTGSAAPDATPPEAVNPLPAGAGAGRDATAVRVGPQWNVVNWGPGPRAAVPAAFAMDTVVDGRTEQKVFVSSHANDDVAAADPVINMSLSLDSALSFLSTRRNAPIGALNMVRLNDGSLLSVGFIPEWTDASRTSVHLLVWRSGNNGETWELTKARFAPPPGKQFGTTDRGLRVHREPSQLPDGTLIMPAYLAYKGEQASSIVLQSTDSGATWTQRGQIPAPAPGTNEVGWSWTTDDRLLAVTRTAENPPRLRTSTSADEGRTWSPAAPLLGPDGRQVVGIYPGLVLQPNGVLLLSTGRPDNRVYVSRDGTGRTWDEEQLVLSRYPSETGNGRYDGSSGNTSLVNVDSDRSVFIGDYCAVWGCKAYHEQYGVFASYISAVTPGTGKIDLETKVRNGTARITGDFARGDRRFPEQRPEGAVDGSSRPRSAAVLESRRAEPEMVVELDREYSVNRIGIMLGSGEATSATVWVSADKNNWTPVVPSRQTRDHALRYHDFAPQQARYVKVTGAPRVTELEVYAAQLDTFENDPEYGIPRGFVDAKNATVSDQELKGSDSRSSLRLFDKFTDDNATATMVTADAARQRTSFMWATNDHRGPFTFTVNGHRGSEQTTPWQFRLTPQAVEAFDGTQWTVLGRFAATIPLNTWLPIDIDATPTSATLTVNGQRFVTTAAAIQTDTLSGITFTTGEPIAYGMTFFVDDLTVAAG
jgi:hypothetical protein